ncbi:MAG: malectin domain-containing carbohydrate-binding protein, partial [Pseudomonadota bacterium]
MKTKSTYTSILFLAALLGAETASAQAPSDSVWAVNVGGPAFTGIDGTEYAPETSVSGGKLRVLSTIKGSQDAFLYTTFREGDVRIDHDVPNGHYDVTLHFAEPDELGGGERVFDTLIEDQLVIDDLDVMASRDGKIQSALTVTVPGVVVTDGSMNVRFDAHAGQPVLSALTIRERMPRGPEWALVWADEFDGDALDLESWSYNIWPARKVNDEDQAYTDRERNLKLQDGLLVIEAHREDYDD